MKFIIFSDTHGDFSRIEKLKRKYFDDHTIVLFLGDLLDAITFSKHTKIDIFERKYKNAYISAIKELKELFNNNFYFIQGNHDPLEIDNDEIKRINLSARYGMLGNLHIFGIPGSSVIPNIKLDNPNFFASFGEFMSQTPQREDKVKLLKEYTIENSKVFVYGNLLQLLSVDHPVNILISHTPPLLRNNFKYIKELYQSMFNTSIGVRIIAEKLKPNIIFAGHEHMPRQHSEAILINDKKVPVIKVGSLSKAGTFAMLLYSPDSKKMDVKIKRL